MSSKKSESSQGAESSQGSVKASKASGAARASVAGGAKRGRKRASSQSSPRGAKRANEGKAITDATITRLFRRADGVRKSKQLSQTVIDATNEKMEELLRVAVQFIGKDRKTLNDSHVVSALEFLGVNVGAADAGKGRYSSAKRAGGEVEDGKKKKKFKAGTVNKRETKKIQKSDKSMTTKAGVRRLVNNLLHKLTGNENARASATAREILQVYIENYIISLLHSAILIATHSKRKTVSAGDVDVARRIRQEIV